MPNSAVRLAVSIRYHDAPWKTIQVDLAAHEGPDTQVDLIDALPLARLGLSGPEQLPCLALPYHIAQKIHAMTQPRSEDGPPNERFRDVVDLLLLAPLVEDVAALRIACNEVFASRATHPWPMDPLVFPAEWREPYSALAIGVGGVDPDFDIAVNGIRRLITEIDAAG